MSINFTHYFAQNANKSVLNITEMSLGQNIGDTFGGDNLQETSDSKKGLFIGKQEKFINYTFGGDN